MRVCCRGTTIVGKTAMSTCATRSPRRLCCRLAMTALLSLRAPPVAMQSRSVRSGLFFTRCPRQLCCWLAISFAALHVAIAHAQAPATFPTKPVRVIVAFPPGGGTDIVARVMAPKLAELWGGQQAIVDNRAGASGVIGTEAAARAAPDGYTWLLGTMGNLTVNQHLYPKMAVDPQRDLTALTQVVAVHFVMVAHPSLPAKNVKELIALAKARPGQINYSSSGPGGAPHLGGELLKSMAGIDLVHIPYKGSGPSFTDLLGGQVSLTFDSLLQALPYIKDGRLKALAVLGSKRSSLLPQVPTVAESGVPGYALTNWFGLTVAGCDTEGADPAAL